MIPNNVSALTWTKVTDTNSNGNGNILKIHPVNGPYILAYESATNSNVYLKNYNSGWNTLFSEFNANNGRLSLALDINYDYGIIYRTSSNNTLKYVTSDINEYTPIVADADYSTMLEYNGIIPYIISLHNYDYSISYRINGNWYSTSIFHGSVQIGCLAFYNGQPHIAFGSNGTLYYSYYDGENFITNDIGSCYTSSSPQSISISIVNNNIYIASRASAQIVQLHYYITSWNSQSLNIGVNIDKVSGIYSNGHFYIGTGSGSANNLYFCDFIIGVSESYETISVNVNGGFNSFDYYNGIFYFSSLEISTSDLTLVSSGTFNPGQYFHNIFNYNSNFIVNAPEWNHIMTASANIIFPILQHIISVGVGIFFHTPVWQLVSDIIFDFIFYIPPIPIPPLIPDVPLTSYVQYIALFGLAFGTISLAGTTYKIKHDDATAKGTTMGILFGILGILIFIVLI